MGLFDGRSSSYSGRTARSPSRHSTVSSGHGQGYYTRPSAARSASSVLGSNSHSGGRSNSSSRGIFGGFGGGGSSYYKRRPRDGYISYLMHRLSRMIKELWYYARRHPVKAFFAVIVPLLSAGGAIHGLLKQFGVRMPMLDGGGSRRSGGGYYGSSGYSSRGDNDWMGGAGSLMQIAKAFL